MHTYLVFILVGDVIVFITFLVCTPEGGEGFL